MNLLRLVSSYVDNAFTKARLKGFVWNLLILSVEEQLSEEVLWLKSKLGFTEKSGNLLQVHCDNVDASIIWSSVLQFNGSLDSVGGIVFIYEGPSQSNDSIGSDARGLFHEVVRQVSFQSRYQFPILIINFNDSMLNATDVMT